MAGQVVPTANVHLSYGYRPLVSEAQSTHKNFYYCHQPSPPSRGLAASVWASTTTDMSMLLVARAVQGLAASLTLVVAMSTVLDRFEGAQAAQLFAMLMTVQSLAPVLAPSVGGIIDAAFGWRAVFLVLAGLVVAGMVVALFGVGVAESTLMALAMSSRRTALGSTAALLGAFQMVIASMSTPIVGSIVQAGAAPWLIFLLGSGVVALIIVALSAGRAPAVSDLAH
ncbi:MFS transporter [Citricoccus alkalitolerans]|uniref:MFS transporter n=1 Tax=Citricoccus alkalitolerans TaxID=246603 RepID=A0ABV8XXW6_9MICC